MLALLALGALGVSSEGPSAPPPPRPQDRPAVRTQAPMLPTGADPAEQSIGPERESAEPESAVLLQPAQIERDAELERRVEDLAQLLAQATAELERQKLESSRELQERSERRLRSSLLVVDRAPDPATLEDTGALGQGMGAAVGGAARMQAMAGSSGAELSREERFAQRVRLEPVDTVRAQRLAHPETTVPQGTLIRGVLETALQSDLPGWVRAQVSEPVLSFTGALVVPRGSMLIGRYQSGLVQGQTRVFVIWQRLLRPDGISVQLGSPATDLLGRAGVTGKVNTKFFERFKGSILLSLLDGGLAIAAARAQQSDAATVVNAGGQDLQNAAELALQNSVNIAPTVEVARGTAVQVFVAQDLDFAEPIVRDTVYDARLP